MIDASLLDEAVASLKIRYHLDARGAFLANENPYVEVTAGVGDNVMKYLTPELAIAAWVCAMTAYLTACPGTVCVWRVRPEICFRDDPGSGWGVYARFAMCNLTIVRGAPEPT